MMFILIGNSYFKENAHFEIDLNIDDIPKILLIKDNKLTN